MPAASRPRNVHAALVSASRYTSVSMTFLPLYLSSRDTTVNRVSRDGRDSAWVTPRLVADTVAATPSVGDECSASAPTAWVTGRTASTAPTPSQRISRDVSSTWIANVATAVH